MNDPPARQTPISTRIAIVGYGNQGRSHAQNIRDSGGIVAVGGRSGSRALLEARGDGFETFDGPQGVANAELVVFALPDATHQASCPPYFAAMPPGSVAGFLHGFSVHFGCVEIPARLGAVLVAPKGPGTALRSRFLEGFGIPCLLAVGQGGPAPERTQRIALEWANLIGCGRAGIVETTFKEEAETDLFGEQAVLCGGILALVRAAYETLVAAGYPPLLAYTECCHEVKQIADLVCDRGIAGMTQAISPTAKFGAMVASERLDDAHLRSTMGELLENIQNGSFAKALADDAANGAPRMTAFDRALADHPLEEEGRRLRAMLPWLRAPSAQTPRP